MPYNNRGFRSFFIRTKIWITFWSLGSFFTFCTPITFSEESQAITPEAPPVKIKEEATNQEILITVTGKRILSTVRTIPSIVTTLSAEDLEDKGIHGTEDLSAHIPNLDVRESLDRRSPLYSVRGLGNPTSFGQPTVITYVDDIPNGDLRGLNEELFDVAYIEAYRGPQITRFGRNAPGGLIYIQTAKPSNEFSGEAEIKYGNYDTQYYRGIIRGPILKDKLHFKLAGAFSKRDGYLKNRFRGNRPDHQQSLDGKAQLFWQPIEELEITLTATAQNADDGAQAFTNLKSSNPHEVNYDQRGSQELDAYLGSLRLAFSAPWFEMKSITTRRAYDADHAETDIDLTPLNLINFIDEYAYTQWTQEMRFTSKNIHGPWRWHGGLYFEDRTVQSKAGLRFRNTAFIQAPPPAGFGLPFTAPVTQAQSADRRHHTYAIFGEATHTAFNSLEITFGLRYEFHRSQINREHVLQAPVEGVTLPVVRSVVANRRDQALLPRLGVTYTINKNLMPFASITRGWRPGGFSQAGDSVSAAEWDPERFWHYEMGLKSWWLNEKINLQAALYYLDIQDYLVRRNFSPTSIGLVNAQKVTSRGFEIEVNTRPLKGLNLDAHFGFTDAIFNRFRDEVNGGRFDGNRVLAVPQYDFMIAAQYQHTTGIFGRVEYQGLGEIEFREENSVKQGAFELLNAKLGYERDFWGVYLFGRNVLNRDYHQFALPGITPGTFLSSPGAPQTFGISSTFKF